MCAEVLLYLFHSLKWHSAVFKESLCSFQDFLLPFQRQCLKQYKVIARASEDLHSDVIFLQVSHQLRSNSLPGAWDTIQIGTNSSLGSIIIINQESSSLFSMLSFWGELVFLSELKKNSYVFFFPLRWNILLWEKKYHHWNPFQIPAN